MLELVQRPAGRQRHEPDAAGDDHGRDRPVGRDLRPACVLRHHPRVTLTRDGVDGAGASGDEGGAVIGERNVCDRARDTTTCYGAVGAHTEERPGLRDRDQVGAVEVRTENGLTDVDHATDPRADESPPQRAPHARIGRETAGFPGEEQSQLGIALELRVRGSDEAAGVRLLRLLARLRPLGQRIDRDGAHHREQHGTSGDDGEEAPVSPVRGLLLRLELAFALVRRAPCEHGLGENVVEDLEARRAPLVDGAQDPPLGERRQHGRQLGFRDRARSPRGRRPRARSSSPTESRGG
jgi:hypothetical protein